MPIGLSNLVLNYPLLWADITIRDAIAVSRVKVPKEYQERLALIEKGEADSLPNYEATKDYFCECISILCDFPKDKLIAASDYNIAYIYYNYIERFVIGIKVLGAGVLWANIESFTYNGKKYYLPETKKVIDMEVPLYNLTFGNFCEASDLFNLLDKDFKFLPYAIASLVVDTYDEDEILRLGEEFEGLDMETAWDVFFCSISSENTVSQGMWNCFQAVVLSLEKQRINQESNGMGGMGTSTTWQEVLKNTAQSLN